MRRASTKTTPTARRRKGSTAPRNCETRSHKILGNHHYAKAAHARGGRLFHQPLLKSSNLTGWRQGLFKQLPLSAVGRQFRLLTRAAGLAARIFVISTCGTPASGLRIVYRQHLAACTFFSLPPVSHYRHFSK